MDGPYSHFVGVGAAPTPLLPGLAAVPVRRMPDRTEAPAGSRQAHTDPVSPFVCTADSSTVILAGKIIRGVFDLAWCALDADLPNTHRGSRPGNSPGIRRRN